MSNQRCMVNTMTLNLFSFIVMPNISHIVAAASSKYFGNFIFVYSD